MFSSKVPFISLTPSCTSGNQTNARTSSNESPLLPVEKRRTIKNVNLRFAAVGGDIINGWSCEWISSSMSAVTHVRTADMWGGLGQMYCKPCKHRDVRIWRDQTHDSTCTHCLGASVALTVKDQEHQRYQTIHASACRNEKEMTVVILLKLDDPEVEHVEGWTEEFPVSKSFCSPLSLSDHHLCFPLFWAVSLCCYSVRFPSWTGHLYHQFCPV